MEAGYWSMVCGNLNARIRVNRRLIKKFFRLGDKELYCSMLGCSALYRAALNRIVL